MLQLTSDPLALGLVAAAQFMPVLVLGLFGGVVADAVNKRNGLICHPDRGWLLALMLGRPRRHRTAWRSGRSSCWRWCSAWSTPSTCPSASRSWSRWSAATTSPTRSRSTAPCSTARASSARPSPASSSPPIGIAPLFFINAVSYLAVIVGLLLMRTERAAPAARSGRRRAQPALRRRPPGRGPALRRAATRDPAADRRPGRRLDVRAQLPGAHPGRLRATCWTATPTRTASSWRPAGVGSLVSALAIAFGMRPTMRLLLAGAAAIGAGLIGLSLSRSLPLEPRC